ncbi:MAG: FG-GAP repeat protein, partial [Cyanobacteriota bacterium]|nr:FG-GAP repeat protein [Cyanobacteriota bacterium]
SDEPHVYVYRWDNGQWQLQQDLKLKGLQGIGFGKSVDVSGNFAIVGQYNVSSSQCPTGAAHIYQLKDGTWQYQQILKPSDLKAGDGFGSSVAIEGKAAIVRASSANVPGKADCGAAYIFQLEGGKWVQKAKLQPLDLGAGDRFGGSVAIDRNVAVVGAYYADAPGKYNCGAAYIFHLESGQWKQQQKLQPLDLGDRDSFGFSVAISGNRAIVGAPHSRVPGKSNVGAAAYIYQLEDGAWQLYQKIHAADQKAGDYFGFSVELDGGVAVVGARYADAGGKVNCGAAYLFQLVNGKWEQKQKLQPSDLPAKGEWSICASFDGSKAIFSSHGRNLRPRVGFAYICDVTTEEAE